MADFLSIWLILPSPFKELDKKKANIQPAKFMK